MVQQKKSLLDYTDDDINDVVSEKQHKELVSLFKQLLSAVKEDSDSDKALAKLIADNSNSIKTFSDKIKELQPTEIPTPNVNVNNDYSEVKSCLEKIENCQYKTNELLQQLIDIKSADWEFNTNRDYNGFISKVTAKPILTKPKYQA